MTKANDESLPFISIAGRKFRMSVPVIKRVYEVHDTIVATLVGPTTMQRSYYAQRFSPSSRDSKPTCWSKDMVAPDKKVRKADRQSPVCATCRWDMAGSAGYENRAKACMEYAMLALRIDGYSELCYLRISPSSLPAWEAFVNKPETDLTRPIRIEFDPYKPMMPKLIFMQDKSPGSDSKLSGTLK